MHYNHHHHYHHHYHHYQFPTTKMENLDPIDLLDALHLLLAVLAWPIRWILPLFLALRASLAIPLPSPPSDHLFFYMSILLATFFFGYCMCPRGLKRRLLWGVAIVFLCASVLGVRMEMYVEHEVRVGVDRCRQECSQGWEREEMRLAQTTEKRKGWKAEVGPGDLASVDGSGVCYVGDTSENPAIGFMLRGL